MGKVVNQEILQKKQEEKDNELIQANMLLELAEKDARIEDLETQNAMILLEVANIKGGA